MAGLLGLADRVGSAGPSTPRPGGPAPPATPGGRTHALLEAHQATQVLLAAIGLGIADALIDGALTTAELADVTATVPERLERLMRGLMATRMVRRDADRWILTADGEALATPRGGRHDSLAPYAERIRDDVFTVWARLPDVIRGADPPAYPDDEAADRFIAAATDALGLNEAVIASTDLPAGASVADIGGGSRRLVELLAERRADLTLHLVELATTAGRAAARLAATPAGRRVAVVETDGQPQLDAPGDRALLVRVLVTLDDETAADLLRFAARSLRPSGRIHVVDVEDDGSAAAAFGDLLNLARSGGTVRAADQWQALAAAARCRIVARQALVAPFVHFRLEPLSTTTARRAARP